MITIRRSADRGGHREDWLDSRFTFSFHDYHDPEHMGFRDLRVINQDRVQPGRGFGLHPHEDMEIFSLVISGALEHEDDLGNREVIGPYQMQKITAGKGIRHSERNPSADEEVHFLQVWIVPEAEGLEPEYVVEDFSHAPKNALTPMLTPDGRDGSARLHQDASVYLGRLDEGKNIEFPLEEGRRHAWIQLVSGNLEINGARLKEGDGAAISEENHLRIAAGSRCEFMLFDLR